MHTTLFNPPFPVCPICCEMTKSFGGTRAIHLGNENYAGSTCEHKFTLYDFSKYYICGGLFCIMNVFANWQWTETISIESGKVSNIQFPLQPGFTAFTAFLTQTCYAAAPDVHVSPKVLYISDNTLCALAPAFPQTPNEMLGTPAQMSVLVYAYQDKNTPGWKHLFYESLHDFAEHRHALSVFKLATSIEIFADNVYESHLRRAGLSDIDMKRIIPTQNWATRFGRITDMARQSLAGSELTKLSSGKNDFERKVRDIRNTFAHSTAKAVTHEQNASAYVASFPILWSLDRMALHFS